MTSLTLDHTHPGNYITKEELEYIPLKTFMGLESNFTLAYSSIYPENVLRNHDIVRWEIQILKFTHMLIMYDNINLHDFLNVPMKSGFTKFLNITPQS